MFLIASDVIFIGAVGSVQMSDPLGVEAFLAKRAVPL